MRPGDEKQLLRRIQNDPQTFAVIYDNHYQSIFSYAFRRLGNYDVAKDIAAETFLKAYQKIGSFQWRSVPIYAWLFRIATNEINLYFRNSKHRPACIDDTDLYSHLEYEAGIETERAAMEKALRDNTEFMLLQQQLLKIDIKYQQVIALRFFEDKSIKEIAAILLKKEGTIKSLLSRGLEKLRIGIEESLIENNRQK